MRQNIVINNDQSLQLPAASNGNIEARPFIPAFETNEGGDCGEGIHLMAVDHSTLIDNDIHANSGGILLTDETGPTHDNLSKGIRCRTILMIAASRWLRTPPRCRLSADRPRSGAPRHSMTVALLQI